MSIMNYIQVFLFLHKRIILAVKRVEFVSGRMSYIILRGHWCHIIVLNVHAPSENKTDDVKDSLYKELECVFDIHIIHKHTWTSPDWKTHNQIDHILVERQRHIEYTLCSII
jgi:hypothetical protein